MDSLFILGQIHRKFYNLQQIGRDPIINDDLKGKKGLKDACINLFGGGKGTTERVTVQQTCFFLI